MRTFSRWMPPSPTFQESWGLRGFFTLLVLAMLAVIVPGVTCVILVGILGWLAIRSGDRQIREALRRLAAARKGEDIGTFARAFDRRSKPFDPWVVRATWDALRSSYLKFDDVHVPLRPNDLLVEELCIGVEELDFNVVVEVAERSGHSLDNMDANPYYSRVFDLTDATVGVFVHFLSAQPRIAIAGRPLPQP